MAIELPGLGFQLLANGLVATYRVRDDDVPIVEVWRPAPASFGSRLSESSVRPVWFDRLDARVTTWMARHGITMLRVSLGVVFLWFGALKFFPG